MVSCQTRPEGQIQLTRQEPTSRIPRPAGPSPALKSGIPTLSTLAAKRKAPSSPIQPSKRTASGSNPSSLGQSTTTRKVSASSGFLPTARKPLSSASTTGPSVGRSSAASSTTRASSLASTSSAGSATRARPAGIGAPKRPPISASAAASGSAVRPPQLGRSTGPGRGMSPGFSGIGSGVASAAQIKVSLLSRRNRSEHELTNQSQNGRLESLERTLQELVAQEQAKGELNGQDHCDCSSPYVALNDQRNREAEQARHGSAHELEREGRRNLSNASEEIASLKATHMREVEELERQVQRKDREKRGLEDELRESRDEISRERQTVRDLKVSLDMRHRYMLQRPEADTDSNRWLSSLLNI